VAMGSCGGGVVLEVLLGGGGGGGHTSNSVSGKTQLDSLASICCARVSVGRPLGLIRIRAVCLYAYLGGDLGTDITSMGLTSLSSTAAATSSRPFAAVTPSSPSSPPSLELDDDNINRLSATESEGSIGQ
jgi:hypothetical protein